MMTKRYDNKLNKTIDGFKDTGIIENLDYFDNYVLCDNYLRNFDELLNILTKIFVI